jgi:hypothetical protein
MKKKRIFLLPIWQRADTQLESESGLVGLFFPHPFSIFRVAQC